MRTTYRRGRGGGNGGGNGGGGYVPPTPVPPPLTFTILTPPSLAADGDDEVGTVYTATAPTYSPSDGTIAGQWRRNDGTEITGETGATYEAAEDDVDLRVYKRFTLSKTGYTTLTVDTPLSGVIQAEITPPTTSDRTVDFGRNAIAGQGGIEITNTGGPITAVEIASGNDDGHWAISDDLTRIIPAATRLLDASYTLGLSINEGAETATYTINTEANAWEAASTTEVTVAMAAANALPSTACKVYVRPGVTIALTAGTAGTAKAWFDSKNRNALLTLQAREHWSDTPSIIDTTGAIFGVAWKNIKIKDFRWNCRFLRETYGTTAYVITAHAGAWGQVLIEDCDLAGDLTALGPATHFRGFFGVSNSVALDMTALDFQIYGTEPIASGNPLTARLHGMTRMLNAVKQTNAVGPAYRIVVRNVDIYDFNTDGLFVGGAWSNVELRANYIHSPFVNDYRVQCVASADDVFVRNTAWTGAADGKKLFFIWSGDWGFAANQQGGSSAVIYAQGTAGGSIKIYRNVSGNICCDVKDTSGGTVCALVSGSAFAALATTPGCAKMIVAVSIDTDRNAQMYIWKERNGGGGSWSEAATASTSGQTMALASAPISFAGLPEKTQKSTFYTTRCFVWYGQAPDLSDSVVRTRIKGSDADFYDAPAADLTGPYGTPILQQEGLTTYWNSLSSAVGTGGNWSDIGLVEVAHGDLIQTAFGATISNIVVSENILYSDYDTSTDYERPDDGAYTYRLMQGYFAEDMGDGHYNDDATIEDNIIVTGSAHGISPYNARRLECHGNILITPPGWGLSSGAYPRIRVLAHGTAPDIGTNDISGNFAYACSSVGSGNTTTPNEGTNVAPADYGSHMTAGADPTTRAAIVAYVAGALS
jgi:hypothetical protein